MRATREGVRGALRAARLRTISGVGSGVVALLVLAFLNAGALRRRRTSSPSTCFGRATPRGPRRLCLHRRQRHLPPSGSGRGHVLQVRRHRFSRGGQEPIFPVHRSGELPDHEQLVHVAASDPVSTGTPWKYRLNQYSNASCSGTPAKSTVKNFYVAKATAYSDSGLTTTKSSFAAGQTAYVVVQGVPTGLANWNTTWVLPSAATACANTAATDRPESSGTGRLPKAAATYLQYRPNTTNTGSVWNRESNYEMRPCVALRQRKRRRLEAHDPARRDSRRDRHCLHRRRDAAREPDDRLRSARSEQLDER